MFNSKKAKALAATLAASFVAMIPVFQTKPLVSGLLALGAAVSTAVVNFFDRQGV